jgi:ribonuclease BN (tRNA processing enzyme)
LRDGTLIIIDAGSGIRPLGSVLGPTSATLLLTHYHWDHIQGLPFFFSAFSPQSSVLVYGPEFDGESPEVLLARQMAHPYFPAAASELRGLKDFQVTPNEPFTVGSATVRAVRVSHPGTTFAYRIEDDDGVFVYMSDDEVDLAPPDMFDAMVDLCRDADLLLHDCQYTESEYATRRGWGHSTPRQAVRLATTAGVGRLMVFHHDPSHADEQVEALAEEARELAAGRCEVIIGREGEIVTLGAAVLESSS